MPLEVLNVFSPQTLDTALAGPGPSNRMFIFTGIAEIDWHRESNKLVHESLELVLSDWHGDIHLNSDPQVTRCAAAAWPASMHSDDDASQLTWAVDDAFALVSDAQRPKLRMHLALQGDTAALRRIGYKVFARTTSIPIKSFDVTFNRVDQRLGITLVLSQPAIAGGEDIYLKRFDTRVVLPPKVTVAAGTDTLTTSVQIDVTKFSLGDTPVRLKAFNAVSEKDTTTIIHRER